MEVYKSETREIIRRFVAHRISFPDCIAALDAALAGLVPRMLPEDLVGLRAVMSANNEIVMKEMKRRRGLAKKGEHGYLAIVTNFARLRHP